MSKYFVLYNAKAKSGHGLELAEGLKNILPGEELTFVDVVENGYKDAINKAKEAEASLLVTGGDGTLNYLVNHVDENDLPDELYYYPCGTGNDFWHDINGADKPIDIAKYLKNLPSVTIKGNTYKFLNGVGYGIDGYCCEVGDQLRAASDKPVNYAGIAIKGLLFYFKPANAVITVDGNRHEYKKVWLAPMMKGRFYGGGMIPTPKQDRCDAEGKLSVCVWHGSGKLPTLMNFPNIFKGEHLKKSSMCEVLTGKTITVEFDAPIAAQVDGETILAVTKCEAKA